MKKIVTNNTVVNSSNLTARAFTLHQRNITKIINIVENDIYSDKILAVIREYSCNAYDANVEAGKKNTPIIVYLPSKFSPEFKIRDHGLGMTEEEIYDTYTSYGESTKDNSDDFIGQLGVGSKSGFAYGDNFVVTSWKNGIKTVYNAVKGDGIRDMVKLYSEPSDEPSGVEVSVPVKQGDDLAFKTKSINFFRFWKVQPKIIGISDDELKDSDIKPIIDGGDWKIISGNLNNYRSSYSSNRESLAIMGNIAYPIEWNLVTETLQKNDKLNSRIRSILNFITHNHSIITFNIGELQMAPSREALQYTDKTINSIIKKLTKICSEIENIVLAQLSDATTLWQYKCNINRMFRRYLGGYYSSGYNTGTDLDSLNNLNEIYKLIENRMAFNGKACKDGNYAEFNNWDRNLGKINPRDNRYYDDKNPLEFAPIVNKYHNKNDRLKEESCGRTYASYRLSAEPNNHFIIIDTDRRTYVKQAIKWYIQENKVGNLYGLTFADDSVKQQFLNEIDISGATIVKLSEVFEDYKPLIKKMPRSTTTLEDNSVRCGVVDLNYSFYYYRRDTVNNLWNYRTECNLKNGGYYVDYSNNGCVTINGEKISISRFFSKVFELQSSGLVNFKSIGVVHGFGKQIMNGKKFARNKKNMTDFVKYVENTINNLCQNSIAVDSLISSRINSNNINNFYIYKTTLEKIVYKLNGDHVFVELNNIMPTISKQVKDQANILYQLHVNTNSNPDYKTLKNKIEKLFDKIAKTYPMLKTMCSVRGWNSNEYGFGEKFIQEIVNYINFVDSNSKNL